MQSKAVAKLIAKGKKIGTSRESNWIWNHGKKMEMSVGVNIW